MPNTPTAASDADACAARPAALLASLEKALEAVETLPELDEARFLETHTLFEGLSNQRRRIIVELCQRLKPRSPADRPLRVLGVGCGGGDVDVSVARALAARVGDVHYIGVDPNKAECAAFVQAFEDAAIPGVQLETQTTTFGDFDGTERFDVIHFVHSLYYMPDPAAAIARARDLLVPGGVLVIVQAPREELNELAALFYDKSYERPTLFANGVAAVLGRWGWSVARTRLDARVDVSALVDGDPEVGAALMDFIVQFDAQRLPDPVQDLIESYLRQVAFEQHGHSFVAHPVDAFFVTH